MASMQSIASNISGYIANELSLNREQGDTIRYGLEIILGTLIKGFVVLTIASILGIVPYVIAALVTSISLRLLSGGTHFRTYWRCMTFSVITAICISYAAIAATAFVNGTGVALIVAGLAIIGYCFVSVWAPADNPNKPIKRKEKQEMYKRLSRLYVLIWATITAVIAIISGQNSLSLALCLASAGGFILQILSISPVSHRLAGSTDDYLDKLRARGR